MVSFCRPCCARASCLLMNKDVAVIFHPSVPIACSGASSKADLTVRLDETSKAVYDFFDRCKPWGSGKDSSGNRSQAGVRQCALLKDKLRVTLGIVERYVQAPKRPRAGRARGARSNTRGGGHRGASARSKRERQVLSDSDSDEEQPQLEAGTKKKQKVEKTEELKQLHEAERMELEELKQLVRDLKNIPQAPQAVAAAPAPPSAEQLTLGGTSLSEAPQTIADRLMRAEVCEHACVLVKALTPCLSLHE